MNKLILIIFLTASLIGLDARSESKFYLDADYSLFRRDSSSLHLEIYFAFYHNCFKYEYSGGRFNASALLNVKLENLDTKSEVVNSDYSLPISLLDTNATQFKLKEISQLNYVIDKEGSYELTLIGGDAKSVTSRDTLKFQINAKFFDISKPQISSIQLASEIVKAAQGNQNFIKYGLEVTPNPNLFFGNNMKDMFYYMEIYGLKNYSQAGLKLHKVLLSAAGKEIFHKSESMNSDYNMIYITGKLNIDSLETGTYIVKIVIDDSSNTILDSAEKKFYIYNTPRQEIVDLPSDDKLYLTSEYKNMGEAQVIDEFDKAIYARKDQDNDNFKKLSTLESKRRFMFDFWRKRDPNPNTVQNEYKIEYYKRLLEANIKFKQGFTEGYRTDRGRFYVVYGPPDEVEKNDWMADVKGYEIWHYDKVEGGKIAVFAEQQYIGSGIYDLVNSTIRNEYRDDDWLNKLKKR